MKTTSRKHLAIPVALAVLISFVAAIPAQPQTAPQPVVPKHAAPIPAQFSIQSFNSVKEIKYPWGWIRWMMNSGLDPAAQQTFGIVQIDAGQRNPLHKHPNCEELLYVLSGSFENVVDGKSVTLHPGDIVRIPPNTPHQGINNTKLPMRAIVSYSSGTRQMISLDATSE